MRLFHSRFLRYSGLAAMISALAACSTPPQHPQYDPETGTIQDTAPGLEGHKKGSKAVQIGGVSPDGVASLEIVDGNGMHGESMVDMDLQYEPVIYFGYDQDLLTDQAMAKVQYFSEIALSNPKLTVVLEGHTDERGTPEYNLALGERRSKSVQDAMVALGVDISRIEANSYGEEYPVAFEKTEEAWQKNRRVEITFR